jgi:RNA polymerase sigma-70 factor (ECF subfamily)
MSLVTAHPASSAFPSDDQLLERYSRGERAALDDLFRRHRDMAYRVAYRLLGNPEDALDAVQEAFVKVLTHVTGFQGRSSFKTWLLRVVSNAALDLGRQRGRRDVLHREELPADAERDPPAANPEPSFELERADLRRVLTDALAQLPEAQRRTFVLHVEGGLSYREVADVLEISIGTVMSRLFYTRQKLRAILADRVLI